MALLRSQRSTKESERASAGHWTKCFFDIFVFGSFSFFCRKVIHIISCSYLVLFLFLVIPPSKNIYIFRGDHSKRKKNTIADFFFCNCEMTHCELLLKPKYSFSSWQSQPHTRKKPTISTKCCLYGSSKAKDESTAIIFQSSSHKEFSFFRRLFFV